MLITMMGMMMPMIIGKMPWINVTQEGEMTNGKERKRKVTEAVFERTL